MSKIRFVLAVILIICCAFSSSYASGILEAFGLLNTEQALEYSIRAEFKKLPQFDETRVQQLNQLMKHFVFSGYTDRFDSSLTVSLDGKDLFTYIGMNNSGKYTPALSVDPGHIYILPEKAGDTPAGAIGNLNPVSRSYVIYQSLNAYSGLFSMLPSLFPDKSSSEKILEKYRDYGTAVRKVSVVLTGEDLNVYFSEHADEFAGGLFFPNPCDLVFENRQSFALFFTEDDVLIKIRYSGGVRINGDDLRSVRIEWKTIRTDTLEKDEFELRTPDSEGTKRDNYLLTYILRINDDGQETFSWSSETDHVADGLRERTFDEASLVSADSQITGTLSETVQAKDKHQISEIVLSASVPEKGSFSGTLEIITKKDKIEKSRTDVRFGISSDHSAEVSAVQPEVLTITEEEYRKLRDRIVTDILSGMMDLPPEDLDFLKFGIPDDVWETIMRNPD